MNLLYYGKKEKIGPCQVMVKEECTTGVFLNSTLEHIKRHSVDGFQWGYGGSGPSDLALSILTDYCKKFKLEDTGIPNNFYQQFKDDFISNAKEDLSIASIQIKEWLEQIWWKKVNNIISGSIVEKHKEFIEIIKPIVTEQINKLDPIGLLDTGVLNAYESEIEDIIVKLQIVDNNFLFLSEIMYVVFAYKFGLKDAKPESKYLLPAQQIIEKFQEQKNEK